MRLVFGENRRQKPLELICPAGRIVIAREFRGSVSVTLLAEGGEIRVEPGDKSYVKKVRLVREEDRP